MWWTARPSVGRWLFPEVCLLMNLARFFPSFLCEEGMTVWHGLEFVLPVHWAKWLKPMIVPQTWYGTMAHSCSQAMQCYCRLKTCNNIISICRSWRRSWTPYIELRQSHQSSIKPIRVWRLLNFVSAGALSTDVESDIEVNKLVSKVPNATLSCLPHCFGLDWQAPNLWQSHFVWKSRRQWTSTLFLCILYAYD